MQIPSAGRMGEQAADLSTMLMPTPIYSQPTRGKHPVEQDGQCQSWNAPIAWDPALLFDWEMEETHCKSVWKIRALTLLASNNCWYIVAEIVF